MNFRVIILLNLYILATLLKKNASTLIAQQDVVLVLDFMYQHISIRLLCINYCKLNKMCIKKIYISFITIG